MTSSPSAAGPELYLDPDFALDDNAGIWQAPVQQHPDPERCLAPGVSDRDKGHPRPTRLGLANEIYVSLETAASITTTCGEGAVACRGEHAVPSNAELHQSSRPLYSRRLRHVPNTCTPARVIVHELLHALGIVGHVDSIEFPDSIMGTSGEVHPESRSHQQQIDRKCFRSCT